MTIKKLVCPVCDQLAIGTIDTVPVVAEFEESSDPFVREYSGYSKVWWEEQKTNENEKGEIELVCANGHDWFSEVKYQ
jgi:hypothetical protein